MGVPGEDFRLLPLSALVLLDNIGRVLAGVFSLLELCMVLVCISWFSLSFFPAFSFTFL